MENPLSAVIKGLNRNYIGNVKLGSQGRPYSDLKLPSRPKLTKNRRWTNH